MKPIDAVLFMQIKQNKRLAKKSLKLACLDKPCDNVLERPSGGEHQKIRIARSIFQYLTLNRKIWMIDEPDNNIHPGTENITDGFYHIMRNILSIAESDTKLIFTTHKDDALKKLKNKINKISFDDL